MTNERDPLLENLFDAASQDIHDDQFVDQVMLHVGSLQRRVVIGWIIAATILLSIGWFMSASLQGAVQVMTQFLPTSLIDVREEWIAQLVAPINSVAAVVAAGFFAARVLYKKIFS